jgi:hypothetical protein
MAVSGSVSKPVPGAYMRGHEFSDRPTSAHKMMGASGRGDGVSTKCRGKSIRNYSQLTENFSVILVLISA